MSTGPYEELLRLVHSRAGDAFRAAVRYDPDGWTALYVRDDVATSELKDALPQVTQRAREYEPLVPTAVYGGLGDTQATVELHEHAALVVLPETGASGILISLDRDVAQGLGEFVNQCSEVLDWV